MTVTPVEKAELDKEQAFAYLANVDEDKSMTRA
jgi:hypothetical protein